VRWFRIHPAPLGPKLALAHRFAGFFVERLSNRGRAALVREPTHHDRPDEIADPHLHRVAQANRSGGFDPIVIQQDLPEVDRFLRKRTRLKKTRRPKPFVEPNWQGARLRTRLRTPRLTHQRGSVE
jgi:hypothetical protein